MKKTFLFSLFLGVLFSLQAQDALKATITLANEVAENGAYYFDLYVQQAADSDGPIYLGHSDFVMSYNQDAFSNPSFAKVEDNNSSVQTGYCTFVSQNSDNGGFADQVLRKLYFDGTNTQLLDQQLIINVAGPTVDGSSFTTGIAVLDTEVEMHRLGRFVINGYKGGEVNLTFDFESLRHTRAFAKAETGNFQSSEIDLEVSQLTKEGEVLVNGNMSLYPNPATVEATLALEGVSEADYDYSLTDMQGRAILTGTIVAGQVEAQIPVEKLAEGVYFVKVSQGETERVFRLVKL